MGKISFSIPGLNLRYPYPVCKKYFSYTSTTACVVGIQKNRLNGAIILNIQNSLELIVHSIVYLPVRPLYESVIQNIFSYISTTTCAVGNKKNRLNGTILLSTKNTCELVVHNLVSL